MAEGGSLATTTVVEDLRLSSSSSSDSEDHYSSMDDDAGFHEVISKTEKKRRRDAARLSEDSDTYKMQNAKKSHAGKGENDPRGTTLGMDASCRKKIVPRYPAAALSRLSDSDSEDEDAPGLNQVDRGLQELSRSVQEPSGSGQEPNRGGRQRLYFPLADGLDYNKKLQWTVKL